MARNSNGVNPPDHKLTIRGLLGIRRMRHVTNAEISHDVG